jgi:hypothetical protein
MIGHKAGYNEAGSGKLYISNSDTASPLIYGDFATQEVTINGNLIINTLKDSSGNSIIRTVGNVVHIGKNSVTLEDASTTDSGKDEIASSNNDLQIGTSTSHSTTIKGTLSVETPTSGSHATTKTYVDDLTTTNSNDISTNSSNINSIQSTNTSQSTLITNNTNNIDSNLGLINANTSSINDLKKGLSQSIAIGALPSTAYGKTNIAVAIGNYDGVSSIAYGVTHHDAEQGTILRFLGSKSNGTTSTAASIGWDF